MKNTLTVNLKGYALDSDFNLDDNQSFKSGDKVLVSHFFNNNNEEWNTAKHLNIVKIENNATEKEIETWSSNPSYSRNNITEYIVGIKTVSRVFKSKMWVK